MTKVRGLASSSVALAIGAFAAAVGMGGVDLGSEPPDMTPTPEPQPEWWREGRKKRVGLSTNEMRRLNRERTWKFISRPQPPPKDLARGHMLQVWPLLRQTFPQGPWVREEDGKKVSYRMVRNALRRFRKGEGHWRDLEVAFTHVREQVVGLPDKPDYAT